MAQSNISPCSATHFTTRVDLQDSEEVDSPYMECMRLEIELSNEHRSLLELVVDSSCKHERAEARARALVVEQLQIEAHERVEAQRIVAGIDPYDSADDSHSEAAQIVDPVKGPARKRKSKKKR